MQITYCDCCGTKLTAENKAGRQQSYTSTITQDHPILPSKSFDIEVNLTYGSSVGMSRVAQNNGDFCQTCLEAIVINSMLQRQADANADDEAEEEEDQDEEAETGDDLDEEGNVLEEEEDPV